MNVNVALKLAENKFAYRNVKIQFFNVSNVLSITVGHILRLETSKRNNLIIIETKKLLKCSKKVIKISSNMTWICSYMFSKILIIANMELILSLKLFIMNFHCKN